MSTHPVAIKSLPKIQGHLTQTVRHENVSFQVHHKLLVSKCINNFIYCPNLTISPTIPELNRKTDELRLVEINEGQQRYIPEFMKKIRQLEKDLADEQRPNKTLQDQLFALHVLIYTQNRFGL